MQIPSVTRRAAGFTLMEMMLVLLIIILIIGALALNFSGFTGSASKTTTTAKIRSIEAALIAYRTDNMMYPTQAQGLEALVTRPSSDPQPKRWSQYVKPDGLIDAWGHKLSYKIPGTHNPSGYDIISAGEDGIEGTSDDIGNW